MKKQFELTGPKLTFEFESIERAELFKTWLCESGEQDFWTWEENHFEGTSNFDYWNGNKVKVKTVEE